MAYGMLINLQKCVGCHACNVACKEAHGTPPGVMRAWVVRETVGTYPETRREITPYLCMHCEEPPCVDVCPTGASIKREDGIVLINKDDCIGCKSCMQACPYGARNYCEEGASYFTEGLSEYEEVYNVDMPGNTVDKCTFCVERVDAGKGEPQACVRACVAHARMFGELEDIKKEAEARGGFQLLPSAGTDPSVWYIPAVIN